MTLSPEPLATPPLRPEPQAAHPHAHPHAHPAAQVLPDPRVNRLLGALADPAYERWLPHLEAVDMPMGMALWEPGCPVRYAYFPTTSIVALSYGLEDGRAAAVSIVGREAIVGITTFMGGQSSLGSAVVITVARASVCLPCP
jgi:CRP-like cAMP-binding protein